MGTIDFNRFEWVSFDCYGTLVDWETGISTAVSDVLEAHGLSRTKTEVLSLFAEVEPRVQSSGSFMEYRQVLQEVMALIGAELSLQLTDSELGCLADTLPCWPVFPEVPAALEALQSRYKLAVISNVDDDLFAGTARSLGVRFDAVVTSQQAGSYKPDLRNFNAAASRMSSRNRGVAARGRKPVPRRRSRQPACIASVWVNRADRGGGTRVTEAVPDLVVADLAELVRIARSA